MVLLPVFRANRPAARACLALALLLPIQALPVAQANAQAKSEAPAEALATEPLTIRSKTGAHAFAVEVMRDDASRARGLMFRRHMAADHGMLFDFGQTLPVNMWMKNTYLPLDMVFIRADGTVARVAADAEPLSTRVIPSGEPVLSVLELNAGTAAKLGIRAGDRVEHSLFRAR
ncbi:DUF192 domain-containing protein [Methylobacterium planeticum]|uniref:DUF192 domain-containing protein n=1 Tax=Methylobacterium planeticum TaxID=2615211 RepID=A0A6N6MYV1_9HYPH|nr:DUF192 domain-containing protein [Methylobacterium planeticum]KAB1076293.1 DUF192 domain-containing protein [Methylobacterium planeticum]